MSHWSSRFLPLAEQYGSARVYKVGLKVCGWPPTIDFVAGRALISFSEFNSIKERLAKNE